MLKSLEKTPWPWFGGKSGAAPAVWAALGDVAHYVEPFAGSLAVLLRRPHPCNRPYCGGFLKGGMGMARKKGGGGQQKRERLWLSPQCLALTEGVTP